VKFTPFSKGAGIVFNFSIGKSTFPIVFTPL